MPQESNEIKAQKLAAARKKLKEYQLKEKRENNEGASGGDGQQLRFDKHEENSSSPATLSEKSDSELNSTPINVPLVSAQSESVAIENSIVDQSVETTKPDICNYSSQNSMDTIQLLIAEKGLVSSELEKMRIICKEKDLENEELQIQITATSKRLEDLQKEFVERQASSNQLNNMNINLQKQLEIMKMSFDDRTEHLEEIKKKLATERTRNQEIEQKFHDKCNELELAQVRINQLSDEASYSNDDRIEALTQTQFMYEQQIRDLQAMVQQLTHDKEQANQQYQNYVQHLTNDISNLSEKNSELSDECSKLQERERDLINHVGVLEKEIQQSIARKEAFNPDSSANNKEIIELKDKLSNLENEQHILQLRIKSQEENFEEQNMELIRKQKEIEDMRQTFQNITAEQPDRTKLLASIESDKVAASRALLQNEDLKKQLDVLQLRIVELTNDKAELTNRLDSEEHVNKEIRNNYSSLEERVRTTEDKLHFKDEEMIRLSHENNDLMKKNLVLEQQLDRLQHYEAREYYEKYKKNNNDQNHEQNESKQDCKDISNSEQGVENVEKIDSHESCHHSTPLLHSHSNEEMSPEHIPSAEAIEKLQHRFTKLISQVADLTDEKQRLEHLVLQLQCETETIGEYIALYQTQRRILKQREYEKAAQMQLLHNEREKMREKIVMLNNLVSSLGAELPYNLRLNECNGLNTADDNQCSNSVSPESEGSDFERQAYLDEVAINKKLGSNESQNILSKIQSIITEIKENTKEIPTESNADHLNCCLGKFEIV